MRKITLILAIVSISMVINCVAEGADWKSYDESRSVARYYDTQSIKSLSIDIWEVSTKDVFKTEELRNLVIQNRFQYKQSIKGYENYSYQMHLLEINCSKDEIRLVSSIDYTKENKVLDASYSVTEWKSVVPESIIEKLFNIVCKPEKK